MAATKKNAQSTMFANPASWPHGAAAAWAAASAPTSLFSMPNAKASWRRATETNVKGAYRRWACWSSKRKTFPDRASFIERVTAGEIEDYVTSLRVKVSAGTITHYLANLKMALLAMAAHTDWGWMDPAISMVKRQTVPVRKKVQSIVSMHDLIALGWDLMENSNCAAGAISIHQAEGYRDGCMIALKAIRPFRLGNFSAATLGKSLIEFEGAYWFQFDGGQTKNKEDLCQFVPDFLQDHLKFYIDQVRPVLAAGRHGAASGAKSKHLWLTTLGTPLQSYGVYRAIIARTEAHFGHRITPHWFRDCLATTMANEDPDNVRMIKFILGHLRSETGEKYYIHAQANQALLRLQRHVLAKRSGSKKGGGTTEGPTDKSPSPGPRL